MGYRSMEFLRQHPFYILFLLFNIWLIYRVIKMVINSDDEDKDEDADDGGVEIDDPILDLPPGVTLPPKPELVEN